MLALPNVALGGNRWDQLLRLELMREFQVDGYEWGNEALRASYDKALERAQLNASRQTRQVAANEMCNWFKTRPERMSFYVNLLK